MPFTWAMAAWENISEGADVSVEDPADPDTSPGSVADETVDIEVDRAQRAAPWVWTAFGSWRTSFGRQMTKQRGPARQRLKTAEPL